MMLYGLYTALNGPKFVFPFIYRLKSLSSNANQQLNYDFLINQANSSIYDSNVSEPLFQPRLTPYYPYIPIHMYSQNLSGLKNTSKLILLGNGFFGDATWGVGGTGKSSSTRSKKTRIHQIIFIKIVFMF